MECKLNGRQVFSIMRLINKLEIKKELVSIITEIVKLNKRQESLHIELAKLVGKTKDEVKVAKVLSENENIANGLANCEQGIMTLGMDLVTLLLEKLPLAEGEIFSLLEDVFNKKEGSVADEDFEEIVEMLKAVIFNKSFQKVFTSIQL